MSFRAVCTFKSSEKKSSVFHRRHRRRDVRLELHAWGWCLLTLSNETFEGGVLHTAVLEGFDP